MLNRVSINWMKICSFFTVFRQIAFFFLKKKTGFMTFWGLTQFLKAYNWPKWKHTTRYSRESPPFSWDAHTLRELAVSFSGRRQNVMSCTLSTGCLSQKVSKYSDLQGSYTFIFCGPGGSLLFAFKCRSLSRVWTFTS